MEFDDQRIYGFDVSFYQDINATPQKIDFVRMKETGASFAVIKAGQYNYADEDFGDNWRNAKLAGLPRSAYWFCDHRDSGQAQARRFWALVKNDQPEGMLFADYEEGSWTSWNDLYLFLYELQQQSGYPSDRIGVYTGGYWWTHSPVGEVARNWFKQFPLWLAWYTTDVTNVKVPLPWTECLLWQDGTYPIGITVGVESKEIDHNKFNGGTDKFKHFMGGEPVPPPDGENSMILYYADLKSGYKSNVRKAPTQDPANIVVTMTGPLTVSIISEKTVAEGYDWYQISEPQVGWIAMTTSYTNFRPSGNVAAQPPRKVTVEQPDGSLWESTTFTRKS